MKKKEKQLENEEVFHDEWASNENIETVSPRQLFENITSLENKFILSHMGNIKGKKILDIGCGLGESSVYFALNGATVTATDLSSEMIRFTSKLANKYDVKIKTLVSPAEKLNFKIKSYDYIYCANLLHHINPSKRPIFIKNVYRFLKKDGWFYSIDPLSYNPIINIYRKMASYVRSPDEVPLNFGILKIFKQTFSVTFHKEFWFLTLFIFLKYFFINHYNPNKVRYWKKIYNENDKIKFWFNPLRKIDSFLLKVPGLRKMAWNIVICAQK
jgi:ubiquinone/menaquinone biosynthesis C-methylase UbiE